MEFGLKGLLFGPPCIHTLASLDGLWELQTLIVEWLDYIGVRSYHCDFVCATYHFRCRSPLKLPKFR